MHGDQFREFALWIIEAKMPNLAKFVAQLL